MESSSGGVAEPAACRLKSVEIDHVFVGVEAILDPHPVCARGTSFLHSHFRIVRFKHYAVSYRLGVIRVDVYLFNGDLRVSRQLG